MIDVKTNSDNFDLKVNGLTWGSIVPGVRPQAQQRPTMSYAQNDGFRAPPQYTNPGGQPSQYTSPGGQPSQYTSPGGPSQYQRGPTPASPIRYQADGGTSQRNTYPLHANYTAPANPLVRQTTGSGYQQSPTSYTTGSTRNTTGNYRAPMDAQPSYTTPSNGQRVYTRPADIQKPSSPIFTPESRAPQSYTPTNAPHPPPPTYQRGNTIEANPYYQAQGITQSQSPVYAPPKTNGLEYNPGLSSGNTQNYPDPQATSSLLEANNASPYYQANL